MSNENGTPAFDFAHLQIEQSTARYQLHLVAPGAYLEMRPAMESNRGYRDGMLALAARRPRRIVVNDVTDEDMRQDREDDLELFPRHVIVGWGGILDKSGAPVPFNAENARALLRALPRWMVDRIRVFAKIAENFVRSPADVPPTESMTKLVGN